ncbi:MAG: YceI family protein [Bacteroidota bacterium]
MRFVNTLIISICICTAVQAQTSWKINEAAITFKIKNAGLTVNGSLGSFNGSFLFSADKLPASKITATVQVNSISTGINKRDNHLKQEEYFNASKFPAAFVSSSFFVKTAEGYRGYFILTMKGVSKEVTIPFTYIETGNTATMVGSVKLNRLDYGIGEKSIILSDEVSVYINISLKKND